MMLKKIIVTAISLYLALEPVLGNTLTQKCTRRQTPITNYTREVLVNYNYNLIVTDLTVSHHTGNVYFCNLFFLQVIKRGTSETAVTSISLEPLSQVYALGVDNYSAKLYLGCDAGLKIYNEITGIVTNTAITDSLYKITIPKNSNDVYGLVSETGYVYKYYNDLSNMLNINVRLEYDPHIFVIDKDSNLYYKSPNSGSHLSKYVMKVDLKGSENTITHHGDSYLNLAVDGEGTVHSIEKDGLYQVNADGTKVHILKLQLEDSHYLICFDENNNLILASDYDGIIVYKYKIHCLS